jgi:hypothetical protein
LRRNFEERNAEWTGYPRCFLQPHGRSSAPRQWSIDAHGNRVTTTWGMYGGKMQTAQEFFNGVNIGQTNEKSPEQYALERAREMCRKKNWEGYREVGFIGNMVATLKTGEVVYLDPIVQAEIDFENLPLSLSFYKPDNTMGAGITKKALEGKVWYTRKRNGMMKVLVKDSYGEMKIYSRRMLRQHDDETQTEYTWDDRFPHIIHAIEPCLPNRTILLGELVVEEDGHERFDLAQSYIKSLTPKAVKDMEESGLFPFFYCWDIAFWDGENLVSHQPMNTRYTRIMGIDGMVKTARTSGPKAFEPLLAVTFKSPDEAELYAKQQGWEGFVVIDPAAPGYGDKAFNFKGKPDRPAKFCAKLKPTFEDDFIAIWDPDKGYGERSTKASRGVGGIKSVSLHQYNKKGELVFIANVNSGLTDELLESLPKAAWPQVWKVEYKGRRYVSDGDDTNALDFPALAENGIRTDKKPAECVNERL